MMVCTSGCPPRCLRTAVLIDILTVLRIQPYIGDCVFTRNLSPHKFQAFISSDTGGIDLWHSITDSFQASRWQRSGWEVVVLRDEKDTWRRGVYMRIKDVSVYITIRSTDDIDVKYGRDDLIPSLDMCLELDPWGPDALAATIPGHRYNAHACYAQPYIGECVLIRSTASEPFRAFVSNYQGGSNSWFTLRSSFRDGRWDRRGWEVLVCKDGKDTWRMGVYIYIKRVTVYVTVKGVGDVEIEYGRDGAYKDDGGRIEREMREATRRSNLVAGVLDAEILCDDDEQPCPRILSDIDIKRWRESVRDSYDAGEGIGRETSEAKLNLLQGAVQEVDAETLCGDYEPCPKKLDMRDISGFDSDPWA
ncbi:hypothetical protein PC9H_002277 [Pleurotus ostreatus]|uniref:Uncharacterized protein n=1 Tax=Pleurotus ostreatus TaxID=5322 RepID=A0A8H6ZQ24_PLEOS|nr:uncharacterized protein PC9H_002277 [Pleurotus ostreatus]KAF7419685.1 hypothetical protein PC9H_002277 [Pleurotus ostreatus]KAJ8689441.1 hypothetical protein PTI98_012344 [Pleurotus ostreatus]